MCQPSHLTLKHIFMVLVYTSYKVHLLRPSCRVPIMLMRAYTRRNRQLFERVTDSITEPNKDRRMDQNSITFKDGRGMFAGESHHTFQFSLLHVEVSESEEVEVLWLLLMTGHAFKPDTERTVCVSHHIFFTRHSSQQLGSLLEIHKENEHLSTRKVTEWETTELHVSLTF